MWVSLRNDVLQVVQKWVVLFVVDIAVLMQQFFGSCSLMYSFHSFQHVLRWVVWQLACRPRYNQAGIFNCEDMLEEFEKFRAAWPI